MRKIRTSLRQRGLWATLRIGFRFVWIPLSRPLRQRLKDRRRRRGKAAPPPPPPSLGAWLHTHRGVGPVEAPATPISVIVPVYDTPVALLDACVRSVIAQTHPHWQLVLADDASTRPETLAALRRWADADERIVVVTAPANRGVAGATNLGIAAATGDYLAFLDHDDELEPNALAWVASCTPEADLIYTDEYKIDERGRPSAPFFKPTWSPVLLTGLNYVNHLTCIRTDLVRQVGGLREGFDGAQDHDLLLRIAEHAPRVAHIPILLYRWRAIAASVAGRAASKTGAESAGLAALAEAIERRGWRARPGLGAGSPFNYRVHWEPADPRRTVKVVIPTRDRLDLLGRAVAGVLDRTDGVDLHLVIVDNGSVEAPTLDYLTLLATRDDVTVIRHDDAFNYSRLVNLGAAAGPDCEFLLLLNNDIEIRHRGWLQQLTGWFALPEVVAVGTKLLFPDGRIQHAGVVVGLGGIAGHYALGAADAPALGNLHDQAREVGAATAAALVIRSDAFAAVGGCDEQLAIDFQDVDLCLRLRHRHGGTIVYDPTYPLIHVQGASRGSWGASNPYTVGRMRFLWDDVLMQGDPYTSPHFDIMRHDLALAPLPADEAELRHRLQPRWSPGT